MEKPLNIQTIPNVQPFNPPSIKPLPSIGVVPDKKPIDALPKPCVAKPQPLTKSAHIDANKKHVGWHSRLDLDKGAKPILKNKLKEKFIPSISKKPFAGKKHLFSDQKLNVKFSNRIMTSINSGKLRLPNIKKR